MKLTNKYKSKREQGFTIIEVLIVLAIAGLIILIVFLAVPALQRNSRNTQRRNDVSAMLGAVQEHINNNGGNLPTTDAQVEANVNLGYYQVADVTLSSNPAANVVNATTADTMVIVTGASCGDSGDTTGDDDALVSGATNRSIVVLFSVETNGGSDQLCQSS